MPKIVRIPRCELCGELGISLCRVCGGEFCRECTSVVEVVGPDEECYHDFDIPDTGAHEGVDANSGPGWDDGRSDVPPEGLPRIR